MKRFRFTKEAKKRILLSKEDFKKLVGGQVVEKDGVEIALQDIGHLTMLMLIKYQMTND